MPPRTRKAEEREVSSELVPQDLSDMDDETVSGEVMEAAANRLAVYVDERGYGPNTTELVQYIAFRSLDSSDLNVVILEQLAAKLLDAKSPDDILTPFDPTHGEQLYGKTIEILSAEFLESDFSEGFPWYASIQFRRNATGPTEAATIGGEKLVMQVAALAKAEMLPMVVKVYRAEKPTKSGFYPIELRNAAS